jgi:N-acetylglucosamine kinase-like BadF-type ATPase
MTIGHVMSLAPEASVVGVDIGGTKTHLRLRRRSGQRDLLLTTSDWRHREWHQDARSLLELVARVADGTPLAAIGVGAHGCDDKDECQAFEDALSAVSQLPVRVVNDAELMPAAFGLEGQIGVVAGTGSIAVCRTAEGEMLVAGGWGWIIGDEGSAASLVREAARSVALHLDRGGTESEPLVRRLFASLEIPSAARIGSRLGSLGNAKDVGSHASLVFDAANEGSALADAVIREGGKALADLVARLRLRGSNATSVVAGGSVIASQPRLWDAFRAGVEEICGPEMSLLLHRGPPVEGAIVLADRLAAERAASPLIRTSERSRI